ncbi:lysosomal alpha-mannosidase-like isoform X3 [Penaeus japonicus]|uniref:lysosomal alpha-mannosidase-like isoform X3 n=1 Tax=Penaeus japonicus TaxID=27405 RepID=UPI001C70D6C0|nr:lysosomal alpha-mannosidase-like isoform X3 [Penaeus japonicus]
MLLRDLLLLLLCGLAATFANPACPASKPGMLNVHLVCHTHDDVGWLKTVDQYYYGAKNDIQMAGVQYVLDSVVRALLEDPNKKFIYVESAFFFRWWDEQTESMQRAVKDLVTRGQLEFINGGWCMNDEGGAHYNAIIDQMTLGMVKLNETFGRAGHPTIAWQIDPFGHSREQASLFAQMGFEGLFFGRLDHDDKSNRWRHKTMEMVWEGSQNLGKAAWLFTGVLPNGYGPPSGFCFDINCRDEPIMDDPRLHDYNVDQRVNDFLKAVADEAKGYVSTDIIMTMGGDFNYQSADMFYKNVDKLIRYVNARQKNGSKVNVFYSTPSCYLKALHDADLTWPTKSDDFFPYASGNHSYWTGYFTSRPTLKGYVRKTNSFLQAVKQVSSVLGMGQDPRLERLKEAMGVLQHHDAVSGTAKQHVTNDYSERLSQGVTESFQMVVEAYSKLNAVEGGDEGPLEATAMPVFCPLLNVSSCPLTEASEAFTVTTYNPLARPRSFPVRVPVPSGAGYKVTDDQGHAIVSQLVPVPDAVLRVPGRNSTATLELVFLAEDIPPLGFLQFHVQKTANLPFQKEQMSQIFRPQRGLKDIEVNLGNQGLAVSLDKDTGLLKSIGVVRPDGITMIKVNQTYMWYAGMSGNNSQEEFRASGAYIFRPDGAHAQPVAAAANVTIVQGPLVAEIHQEWTPWVSQVIRAYKEELTLEMEWLVGPIPVKDGIGKEIVSRVIWPDISTNGTFYTDANGREMLKRVKNYRPTWQLHNAEPVAGNYYPVNSRLVVSGGPDFQAALMNDRSQGGTSLDDGHMELMLHRRLLHDDAFGVGEPLNETAFGEGLVARGKLYLLHSDFANDDCDFGCLHRSLGEKVMLEPVISFTPTTKPAHAWRSSVNAKWSALTRSLPANVHLLTLEPFGTNTFLLRLEHMYEAGESKQHSQPASVNLKGLLVDWEVTSAVETTLAADLRKEDLHRYQWKVSSTSRQSNRIPNAQGRASGSLEKDLTVSLQPMQIRTFILTVKNISP